MSPVSLERVFGTSRLQMVTGKYVEVYREAAAPGERRRYTKRFLSTEDGDFREWTEREWRILARLVGHGLRHVPDVVQYDRGAAGGDALVQTYDAGVTVDHWATLLPVQREGRVQRHIFQDCAHWWALARQLLLALHEIHPLRLVHLDLKADNICVPLTPTSFDPTADDELFFPAFESIALIDFAFSVVTGETLTRPLPIGWQKTYRYQSPRLLHALTAGQKGDLEPTRQLDWRCDMYSLAALLGALLPLPGEIGSAARLHGWTDRGYADAKALLVAIRQSHDQDIGEHLPHLALAAACDLQLDIPRLAASLQRGWALATRLGSVAAEGNAFAPTAPQTHLVGQPFTAPTEVLPQSESRKTDEWIDALFGTEALAAPFADPIVTAINAPPVTGSLVTVTEVLPHPQSGSPDAGDAMFRSIPTQPAAVSTGAASDMTPSLDASAVPDAEQYGLLITAPPAFVASSPSLDAPSNPSLETVALTPLADVETQEVSGSIHERPADPSPSDRPPAAASRPDENERRPKAVYLLPILALVTAMAWWLAPSQSPDDKKPQTPGTSSADVDVATSTGKVEPAVAPAPATSSAARVEQVEVVPAAIDSPPSLVTAERPPARTPERAAPVTNAQPPVPAAAPSPEARGERTAERAQETLAAVVPLIVGIAEPRVAHVLSVAHQAQDASEDRRTVVAAATIGEGAFKQAGSGVAARGPALSRQLNAAANQAFYQGHSAAQAYALQRRAFTANPSSVEVAGNLAFYALKMDPPRADESRELAIYALALATRANGPSRPEDWGNLAVASALSGRPEEAKDAMLVLLSVSPNVNRSCHSALSSVASHGPNMRIPAETLLRRAQSRVDVTQAPQCFSPSPRGR